MCECPPVVSAGGFTPPPYSLRSVNTTPTSRTRVSSTLLVNVTHSCYGTGLIHATCCQAGPATRNLSVMGLVTLKLHPPCLSFTQPLLLMFPILHCYYTFIFIYFWLPSIIRFSKKHYHIKRLSSPVIMPLYFLLASFLFVRDGVCPLKVIL